MSIDLTVKIGGEAGQGIQTVGQLLALTCHGAGLYLFAVNDFESRIRGGHNFFQIRISDRQVRAPHHQVAMLVCLDRKTLDLHHDEVIPGGLILMAAEQPVDAQGIVSVPIFELARKAGSSLMTNTVAAGICLALLGAPLELFLDIIAKQFAGKSPDLITQNLSAARLGYEAISGIQFSDAFDWEKREPRGKLLEGSQSVALGALAGDLRFAAFYPMSPATGIMAHLARYSESLPLMVEQAEDEIAAANMVIGSSFAGARSMTATSGGGFCLMTEALGLAGMSETPIVIVNAQRPGPATGMATRTGQGDLLFVIHASQDEFPRFVFAPGSPEEAYETAARALRLSDKYQVPALILVDQYFLDSLYITEEEMAVPDTLERFVVEAGDDPLYKRYALNEDGVSPRRIPCNGMTLVVANGNEHDEGGHSTEVAAVRAAMVNKRNAKAAHMRAEMTAPAAFHGDAPILLIGWGSTAGAVKEAAGLLRQDGIECGSLHFADLWPFPAEAAQESLAGVNKFFTVENNSDGQFARLLRQETGLVPSGKILKFDGRTLYPREIADRVTELVR